jgi:hypothetical protein
MACKKGFKGFGELLQQYDNRRFLKEDGTYDITTNVATITEFYSRKGLVKNDTEQLIEVSNNAFYSILSSERRYKS